jgi:anti-sigma B factor antagonist
MAVSVQTDVPDALATDLRIVVTEQGTTTTIALDGEWDLTEREATRHAIRGALARQPDRLVLDLRDLTFMDSTGVHVTTELARDAARLNLEFAIVPGPRAVQHVFEICQRATALPFVKQRLSWE